MPRPLPPAFVQLVQKHLASVPIKSLKASESTRRAAVFVPLCAAEDGTPSILFTERSSKVGTHKGQVSFPGGHIDANETPEAAAAREFQEEVALPTPWDVAAPTPLVASSSASAHQSTQGSSSSLGVLGRWHDAIAITGTHVTPVLGYVHGDASACVQLPPASPDEVESVFMLTLPELADPEHYEVEDRSIPYKSAGVTLQHRPYVLPVFKGGPRKVWGLTAYMLDSILRQVLLPAWSEFQGGQPLTLPPYVVAPRHPK